MSESGVIFDGVLGVNKAEVNSSNELKVAITGSVAIAASSSVTVNIDSVTGSAADAQKVAIFDPVTGATAEVDAFGSLMQAAVDSVGVFIENKAEVLLVGVTTTTTQQVTSSVQTNLNGRGALFYAVVSTTVTTTVRLNFQTTCEFLNRFLTFASLSFDGMTGGTGVNIIHYYPGAQSTVNNPLGGVLPRTFQVLASITSSTSNTFTPSVTVGMKRVI